MMFKVFVIVGILSYTNAAFTVNIYDDGQNALSSSEISSCNYNACDQLCRRLGFPGGACVGDRCKCDNFKQSLGVDALEGMSNLESCNYRECDQLCRRLGFPGGACVGDRCKCDNFKNSTEQNEIELARGDNQNQAHDVQDLEKSEIELAHEDSGQAVVQDGGQTDVNTKTSSSRASCDCNQRSCDFYCFRLHYTGGICVTGICRCYK